MLKKLILSFLTFTTLFISSASYFAAPQTHAQDTNPWYSQSFPQWYVKVYDTNATPAQEIFGERYTAAQVQWVIYSIFSFILGPSRGLVCVWLGGDPDGCYSNPSAASAKPNVPPIAYKGVFETLFDSGRPISAVNYVRGGIKDMSLIATAQAQNTGFGFQALNPIQNVWRIFRDIMYGFFVIVIIVFAFMIMFRVKISPQVVISVQSALPKIVMTLIFVTFSYAIGGFLIDMTYVIIGLIALVFSRTGIFVSQTPWFSIFRLLTEGPSNSSLLSTGIIGWFNAMWYPIWIAIGEAVSAITGMADLNALESGVAHFVGWCLMAGVAVWMILNVLKVFILLIKTYVSIIVSIIFSPILIGFGALTPGGGFSSWIKSLVSNLLVYPVTGVLLLLSVFFLSGTSEGARKSLATNMRGVDITEISDIFGTSSGTSGYWYPPLTLGLQSASSNWNPLPVLWVFAAIGIIATIPKVAEMVKALMAGKSFEGIGVGETANQIFAGGLGYAALAGKFAGKQVGKAGGFVGGGVLDTALTRYGSGAIEGLRGSPRSGIVGASQRFIGRQLTQLGERRGLRNVPSSSTGWYKKGDRPL